MIIVFLGPPGSGKGTQAQLLDDEHGFYHFDTGSLLRAEVASGSELGQKIAGFINQGLLVPLETIRELLLKFFRETKSERIMLDGFPRNLDQAKILEEGLEVMGAKLDHAIYLDTPKEALLERIVNRRFCSVCGEIYNLKNHPPQSEGKCDKDGEPLIQRKDDTPEVFGNRIEVYEHETSPLLAYYEERGLLRRVDGLRDPESIVTDILELLGV
jgi:adenylate kinase